MLFNAGTRIAALFNAKAKKWVSGRRHIFERLEMSIDGSQKIIWMHCASLGEFEQGRPLIEKLRTNYPDHKILLTFFSPSGYEIRKNYPGADWVFYLPLDGPRNAKRFLNIVQPSLVIFVKYEFWYYYLKKMKYRNIPLLLVSAIFHPRMSFFRWYGTIQRKMLSRFDHLFLQDAQSKELLSQIGIEKICTVCGDTRFDRVIEIAEQAKPIPEIEHFIQDGKAIIAGSTWPPDEEILQSSIGNRQLAIEDQTLKLIIAPHEINAEHIEKIQALFPESVLFSQLRSSSQQSAIGHQQLAISRVLIIDNIGLLSRLYQHAWITYIGGGFGKGIHNTLEAAVYGKPVLFGPNYQKFREATELVNKGGAISINAAGDCEQAIIQLLKDTTQYNTRCKTARDYVYANKGATDTIIRFIQEKRLLTR